MTTQNRGGSVVPQAHGGALRPFPKGNRANPGGRPKGLAALVRQETDEGAELVAFMLRVLRSTRQPTALRLQACAWLADRGFGKAVVQLEGTMSATVDATVTQLDGVRAEIRARLTRQDADAIARRFLGN